MNRSRLLTIGAAVVAVGATALATSGIANAVPAPTLEWVNTPAQLTSITGHYDATQPGWTVNGPVSDVTFGAGGATLTSSDPTAPLLLAHASGASASSLATLVDGARIVTTSGSAYFGVDITDADGNDYLVSATQPGAAGLAAGALFSFLPQTATNEATIAGNANYTIEQIEAGLGAGSTIAAYGIANADALMWQTPGVGTVGAIEFADATTYFTPTAAPLTITPTTTTVSTISTTGVTVSGTGFFPGETVATAYASTAGDAADLTTTFVADENGDVTGLLPVAAITAAGTYSLVLVGTTSGILESGVVTVTADAAATDPTTPAAPSTPADPAAPAAPVATPIAATATFTG